MLGPSEAPDPDLTTHRLPWPDFDALSRGEGGPGPVRRLRAAERSRRLLLLRDLIDKTTKNPESFGPLPSPELAWELLARAQNAAPDAVETLLAHPYTGTWLGYTTRLFHQRRAGVCPFWAHLGHVHNIAAAAGIRACLDFETEVPVWRGDVSLPTLGVAHLEHAAPFAVAEVRAHGGAVEVVDGFSRVVVPTRTTGDSAGWTGIQHAVSWASEQRFAVRIDDVDPYRGLYEPIAPRRLGGAELESWRTALDGAWKLLVNHLPGFAQALPEGLESIVPTPAVPFRLPSASSGEAFGSAVIAHPDEPATLAATLIHEFQHIRLGGLQHLVKLAEDDARERIYVPWRDDPRPIGGVLHGIYAFFGVTAFWRALAAAHPADTLAGFEFSLWRGQTWRTLRATRDDPMLTEVGRRFLSGVASQLEPWQDEPVAEESAAWADAAAIDHNAGWRVRHLRADERTTAELSQAWVAGQSHPHVTVLRDSLTPTPIPDGSWPDARPDLIRLTLGPGGATALVRQGPLVPGVTQPDLDYVAGRTVEAIDGYRAALSNDPDDPSMLIGLGLALSARSTGPASRALLHRPELVRAVHRVLRVEAGTPPTVEAVAGWIGRFFY